MNENKSGASFAEPSASTPLGAAKRQRKEKWADTFRRTLHDHDVRTLCVADRWLISGGVDGMIGLSMYPPKRFVHVAPFNPVFSFHSYIKFISF